MPPDAVDSLVETLRDAGLLTPAQAAEVRGSSPGPAADPSAVCDALVRRGWLTPFQAGRVAEGRARDLVLGPYLLLDRLGAGGMGEVYKARHTVMDRVVALKVIRADRLAGPEAVGRFRREVRAVARVSHPNVVTAHDAAEVNGVHFYVMEYLDGIDLARLVRASGPLPVGLAAECVRQAALGLDHARRLGLVHRDVKPANLMLVGGPGAGGVVVKVLDLGLARGGAGEPAGGELTRDGVVMGTPDYIAPEQADDPKAADTRADVYALGCTLYHLLAGRPPFPGGTLLSKLTRHRDIDPVPVELVRAEVPDALAAAVRRMMAKRPADRYPTPGGVAEALAPFASAEAPAVPAADPRPLVVPAVSTVDESRAESADTVPGSVFGELAAAADGGSGRAGGVNPRRPRRRWAVAAGLLGLVAMLAAGGVLFYAKLKSADGKTEVNILAEIEGINLDDTAQAYSLDTIPVAADDLRKPVRLDHGRHEFVVGRAGAVVGKYVIEVGRGAEGGFKITQVQPPAVPAADPDRAAAGWVLANGGTCKVAAPDRLPKDWDEGARLPLLTKPEELPKGPFRLLFLGLHHTPLTDDDLRRFDGLTLSGAWLQPRKPGTWEITDRGLERLGGQAGMLILHLYGNKLTDDGLRHLGRMTKLEVLYLNAGSLAGAGLKHLAGFDRLRFLSLRGNWVTDGGLESLPDLPSLAELELDNNKLTDACVPKLARYAGLKRLTLEQTGITPAGLEQLRKALPGCRILPADPDREAAEWVLGKGGWVEVVPPDRIPAPKTELDRVPKGGGLKDLPPTPFRLVGFGVPDGVLTDDAMRRFAGLPVQTIWAPRNPLTDAGLAHLKGNTGLRYLMLDDCKGVTDAGLAHLGGVKDLEQLYAGGTRITGTGCRHLRASPLVRLGLAPVTDAGLEEIAALPKLAVFHAAGPAVTDDGFRHLRKLDLVELRFVGAPSVTDDGFRALRALGRLGLLELGSVGLTDDGLKDLAVLDKLDTLILHPTRVTGAGLAHLKAFPALTTVHLHGPWVTDAGVKHLAAVPGLRDVRLADTRVGDGAVDDLAKLTGLKHLNVTGNRFTADGVRRLRAALPGCQVFPTPAGDP